MRLTEPLARSIAELAHDERFQLLWGYFRKMNEGIQEEINEVITPTEERELLVRLRAWIEREILDLPKRANTELDNADTPQGPAVR